MKDHNKKPSPIHKKTTIKKPPQLVGPSTGNALVSEVEAENMVGPSTGNAWVSEVEAENKALRRELETLRRGSLTDTAGDHGGIIVEPGGLVGLFSRLERESGMQNPYVRGVYILKELLHRSQSMKEPLRLPITPHDKRLKSGNRGVSEALIMAFVAFLDLNGCEVDDVGEICKGERVELNVCHLTRSTGLSLAESVVVVADELRLQSSDLVGTAQVFNSYSWFGSSLREMLKAIMRASARLNDEARGIPPPFVETSDTRLAASRLSSSSSCTYAWIDLFCASQLLLAGAFKDKSITRESDLSGYLARKEDTDNIFEHAIETTSTFVFQCSPLIGKWDAPPHPYLWEERERNGPKRPKPWVRQGPIAISRAWCLKELALALRKKQRLVVELNSTDMRDLSRMLESDFEEISRIFDRIEVKDCQISKIEDREYINHSIAVLDERGNLEGGYTALNTMIKEALREWLVDVGRETLAKQESKVGKAEPLLLRAGLGELMFSIGNYKEAEHLLQTEKRNRTIASLETQERLGRVIAMSSDVRKRKDEALPMLVTAHDQLLGIGVADIAPDKLYRCQYEVADVYRKLQQNDEAIELYTRALEGFDGMLATGSSNSNLEIWALSVCSALAAALCECGRLDEAKRHFERCHKSHMERLGPKAGETLWVMGHLGKLYAKQKEYTKAAEMCQAAMEGNVERFGEHHKATIKNTVFYAEVLELQELYEEATQFFCRAFLSRRDALKLAHDDKDLSSLHDKLCNLLHKYHGGMALDAYIDTVYRAPRPLLSRKEPSWLSPAVALNTKLTLADVDLRGRRIMLRCDLNVELEDWIKKPGQIRDDTRIRVSLPTIEACLAAGAKSVVLCSHLGRPDGVPRAHLSLAPVAKRTSDLLGRPVRFLDACTGEAVEAACRDPPSGTVLMLENTRFCVEEEGKGVGANGEKIAASEAAIRAMRSSLARLGDIFVMDAFATAHRAHSSVLGEGYAVRCMGLLVEKELRAFSALLDNPKTPILGICGGYKLNKIEEIKPLVARIDSLILCGGVGSAFLKSAYGVAIGGEAYTDDAGRAAVEILEAAKVQGIDVNMPRDWIVSIISPSDPAYGREGTVRTVTREQGVPTERVMVDLGRGDAPVERQWKPFDIGPATRQHFCELIRSAHTIFWNGPPGSHLFEGSSAGSREMAEAVAAAMDAGAQVLLGGGATSQLFARFCPAAATKCHVSSGGGVSLELMAHKTLPALAALTEKGESSLGYTA